MMEFVDISKWNGVFNWSKAQAKGVEGAYLKATGSGNGGNYVDFRFKENSASCPLKYKGTYHYFDYRGYSGADQCKYFLDKTGNFGNLRGVLDMEDNATNGWVSLDSVLGVAMREALAWVNEYKKECGHAPVLYLNSGLAGKKQLTLSGYQYIFRNFLDCPLWVANYNQISTPPSGAWLDYAMWQYTSKGDGIGYGNAPGNMFIDLNRVKNLSALLKPGVTIEDEQPIPVVIPEPSDAEKLSRLWKAHPEIH